MQTPFGDSPPPQILRQRRVACIPALPLSVQEYIAAEINRFLEAVRGEGSVEVENDLLVSLDGVLLPGTDPATDELADEEGQIGTIESLSLVKHMTPKQLHG